MRSIVALVAAVVVLTLVLAGTAAAQCQGSGCSQTVSGSNTADDHAETHADNGGLSRAGGVIRLGESSSVARSVQRWHNRQRIRLWRAWLRRFRIAQAASIVNASKNLSAATSANTGESSQSASTTTGNTRSETQSEQSATNDQSLEIEG